MKIAFIMLSDDLEPGYFGYRIKMIVAIENDNVFSYRNEFVVPVLYADIEEAQSHIQTDIGRRLRESLYFRSQKSGFDLVRYGKVATSNTYIAYRIVPSSTPSITRRE